MKFPTSIEEAKKFQLKIREKIVLNNGFSKANIIGACDIAYKQGKAFAASIIYDCEKHKIIEERTIATKVQFPYIPGYLFLRETPPLLVLLEKITNIPDIMIIDGHGIAHPRTAGSATIFGILTGIPSIGVAKKPMKNFEYKPTKQANRDFIILNKEIVGFRHRFDKKWNPIYISPGNKISLDSSYNIIKGLLTDSTCPSLLVTSTDKTKGKIHES